MNSKIIKTSLLLTLMTAIITMAVITKNVVKSQLFASFGVILGAYASGQMLTQNEIKNGASLTIVKGKIKDKILKKNTN